MQIHLLPHAKGLRRKKTGRRPFGQRPAISKDRSKTILGLLYPNRMLSGCKIKACKADLRIIIEAAGQRYCVHIVESSCIAHHGCRFLS